MNQKHVRSSLCCVAMLWSVPAAAQYRQAQLLDTRPILPADYPATAIAAGAEGVVDILLLVGVDGTVGSCVVTNDGADAALSDTACTILSERARFEPASNNGSAMRSSMRTRVTWALPVAPATSPVVTTVIAPELIGKEAGVSPKANPGSWFPSKDYPREAKLLGEAGSVTMLVTVDRTGRVSDCDVIESSGSATLARGTCQLALRNGRFTPALDADGRPRGAKYFLPTVHWAP